MKIGIHGGSDQGTVDNCKRIGVDEVCLTLPYGNRGYVELDVLKKAKNFLADAGIGTMSGHLGSFPGQDVMTGQADAKSELENLSRTMDSLGEVGFYSVLNFASSLKPPTEKEEQEYWARLLDYYTKFVAMAENAKVRIATHAFYYPDRLVQDSNHLMRILKAIPSDYNGVTLCGGLHIPGDDVSRSVEMFKGKIFFAHARDVKGSRFASERDTVEVPLGEGDVNVPSMIDALQRVGYEGIICPEHLGPPKVQGEDQLGEAVKYLKRLMSA
jgi:D-mannonate dehydratase